MVIVDPKRANTGAVKGRRPKWAEKPWGDLAGWFTHTSFSNRGLLTFGRTVYATCECARVDKYHPGVIGVLGLVEVGIGIVFKRGCVVSVIEGKCEVMPR